MKSLVDLQHALLSEDRNGVNSFFDDSNRRTSNHAMLAASEALGFKIGMIDGWFVTTMGEVQQLMGHKSDSTVRKMRSSFGLMSFTPGTSATEFTKLKEIFGLHSNDGRTVFVGWDTILVCAMKSTTAESDRIKLYLLDCERSLRTIADKDLLEQRKLARLEARDFARHLEQIRKSPDDALTEIYRRKVEEAFGCKLPKPSQLKLV